MARIDGICEEVLDKTEWIAVATTGPDGPHLVATWGEQLRALSIEDGALLIPVGHMHKSEANLKHSDRVELLCATRQVQGTHGPGKGCGIVGKAEFQTTGPRFDAFKAKFQWARAALVVNVEDAKPQL